jgi:hypothetical protein
LAHPHGRRSGRNAQSKFPQSQSDQPFRQVPGSLPERPRHGHPAELGKLPQVPSDQPQSLRLLPTPSPRPVKHDDDRRATKLTFDNDLAIVNLVNFDCCSESPGCVCCRIDHSFRTCTSSIDLLDGSTWPRSVSGVARQTAVIFIITVDRGRAISGVFTAPMTRLCLVYPAENEQLLPLPRS